MKPAVPEKGTILRLEGDTAVVLLEGGHSCKGCGAARIGLCRATGSSMILSVKNEASGKPGDRVLIGIAPEVRIKGFLFAYIFPLVSFMSGELIGHVTGSYYSIPSLDVITGFVALVVISGYTLNRLRRLDLSNKLIVKKVVSDDIFRAEVKSDEERRYEGFAVHQ